MSCVSFNLSLPHAAALAASVRTAVDRERSEDRLNQASKNKTKQRLSTETNRIISLYKLESTVRSKIRLENSVK